MIIQWKKAGPLEYVANWDGHTLSLQYDGYTKKAPWNIRVDGKQCTTIENGTKPAYWWTPTAAMEAMEAVVNGLIANRKVAAVQRPRSAARIVRHA